MTVQEELHRLDDPDSARPEGLTVEIFVDCPVEADVILERCKNVLRKVVDPPVSLDAPVADWTHLLPEWFVKACYPEITRAEADEIMSQPAGSELLGKMWSVSDFLHWFKPEMRLWHWWSSEINGPDKFTITLLIDDWPFPSGALHFLLKAAGATESTEL